MSPALLESLAELQREELLTTVGRCTFRQTRPRHRAPAIARHYPPDALRTSGRSISRQILRAPTTVLSLLDIIGDQRHHTVYVAKIDHTDGQCYDPELALGVRQALREALSTSRRSGHPAWVSIECGRGHHPLHIHVMSAQAAPLPASLEIHSPTGVLLAQFTRRAGRTTMSTAIRLLQYLRKAGHWGAGHFDARYPAHDPRQPAPFRKAYKAWTLGQAKKAQLGFKRAPQRTFGICIPRLSDQTRRAALGVLRSLMPVSPVVSVSRTEWHEVTQAMPLGTWRTERHIESLRATINILIRAAHNDQNVYGTWKIRSQHHRTPLQTVYNTLKRLGWPTIEKVMGFVRDLRLTTLMRSSRLVQALSKKLKG